MKVLFLDHDGVICLSKNWGSRFKKQKKSKFVRKLSMDLRSIPLDIRFDDFDKKTIRVLNEIIEETNCEIVISSDWRNHATLNELSTYYESQGIVKSPISFTPWFIDDDNCGESFFWDNKIKLERIRCSEIKKYLKTHPEIEKWVCVDDLNLGDSEWGLENFVRTYDEGLKQSGIKEKVLGFLKT